MNLQQLITFSTVVAEGSMTAAAEKLYLTQPAVSQQIRNLEEELGVNLLVRGVRHARPSVQGQLLFDYAKKIIALTQAAQVAVQTLGEGLTGSLRVGALNSLGLYMLSPLVGTFLKHNPKVKVRLLYDDGPELLRQLQAGEIDAAILPCVRQEYGRVPTGVDERPLMKDEMWLVASGRALNPPGSILPGEITQRPLAQLRGEYPAFDRKLTEALEKVGVKIEPVIDSNNVGTLKKVIESGLGWGFLPAHSVRKQVRAGRLTVVDVPDLKHVVNINYFQRASLGESPISDVFYKALKFQSSTF